MTLPLREGPPPAGSKGNVSRRRDFDELVLQALVTRGAAMSVGAITTWLGVRYPYGSAETVRLALKRLERAGKVENLGRAVGWRVKEAK